MPEGAARIALLPGDGIGPEIVGAARRLLDAVGDFDLSEHPVGGASIDAHGVALADEVLEACREADAVLLGAVGGPKWESTGPGAPRPEQGLLGLRKGLGLYANLRPVRPSPSLLLASPLREERIRGTDLLVVRELTGGIYFGDSGRDSGRAHDTCEYSTGEIERIARVAFDAARTRAAGSGGAGAGAGGSGARGSRPGGSGARGSRAGGSGTRDSRAGGSGARGSRAGGSGARGSRAGGTPRVTSVDKANVLETSRLWRETVDRVAGDYDDVALDHMLVDNAAMQLVSDPARFDVLLTENMFGDILSDEAAMLTGSLGMLPSASLGDGGPGLFEPVHGSAPDIAGKGIANPLATFLSVALLLRHGLEMPAEADAIAHAVEAALAKGVRTPDLAWVEPERPPMSDLPAEVEVGTDEMTAAVLAELA